MPLGESQSITAAWQSGTGISPLTSELLLLLLLLHHPSIWSKATPERGAMLMMCRRLEPVLWTGIERLRESLYADRWSVRQEGLRVVTVIYLVHDWAVRAPIRGNRACDTGRNPNLGSPSLIWKSNWLRLVSPECARLATRDVRKAEGRSSEEWDAWSETLPGSAR